MFHCLANTLEMFMKVGLKHQIYTNSIFWYEVGTCIVQLFL
jgi:hypothetical protein